MFFIQSYSEKLNLLCVKYGVEKLYLFGSAANGNFDEKNSDIDLLYILKEQNPLQVCDNVLDLYEDLQLLFERKVDLVSQKAIQNKYFIQSVNQDKILVYSA